MRLVFRKSIVKVDSHFMQNVARTTTAFLKLNRFLLGSIRELLGEKTKVTRTTFCTKWKSTFNHCVPQKYFNSSEHDILARGLDSALVNIVEVNTREIFWEA